VPDSQTNRAIYKGAHIVWIDLQDAPIYRLRAGIALTKLLAENGQFEEAMSAIGRLGVYPLEEWTGKEVTVVTQLRSELGAQI
jgi:hypothetical protein